MSSDHTADQPTPAGSATKEIRVYEAWKNTGWGNRIGIWNWDEGKIEGHLPRIPKVGDHIRFRMQSGNVLDTVVTEVQTFPDPPDQFFATVEKIGYVEPAE